MKEIREVADIINLYAWLYSNNIEIIEGKMDMYVDGDLFWCETFEPLRKIEKSFPIEFIKLNSVLSLHLKMIGIRFRWWSQG